MIEQHFVEFFSPGTLFAETSLKPIPAWEIDKAMRMADTITERHGATPYAFDFVTRGRSDAELDSKEIRRSARHFLGGRVLTLADVEREMPNERILLSNMRCNGYARIVINDNSWRSTQPLRDGDIVLDYTPPVRVVRATP